MSNSFIRLHCPYRYTDWRPNKVPLGVSIECSLLPSHDSDIACSFAKRNIGGCKSKIQTKPPVMMKI